MKYKEKGIVDSIPELNNAKLLYYLLALLVITNWVVPPYFGIHIGFDFTVTRVLNILILGYFLFNRKAGAHFIKSMLEVQIMPFLALYMFVMVYTTILRVNINTFFLNFLDILTYYMIFYAARYVIGIRKVFNWTIGCSWFLALYGILEYILKFSPMIRFMRTLPMIVFESYRSGQYRIMGPCGHSIGYGMLLLFLIALACVDFDRDEVFLFKRPVLIVLLLLNVFLTGSRSTLGLAALEALLIIIFTKGNRKVTTVWYIVVALIAFIVFVIAVYNTSLGRYIMMQITSVLDEVLGTSFSANYGADTTWLQQSTSYRDKLPLIFKLDWLNPLLGRGANARFTFEVGGSYLKSLDNYYVALYVRYAYPGLIATVLIHLMSVVYMMKSGHNYKSGLCFLCGISIVIYSINLYWVDYLMTTKFMYIVMAIYAAYYSLQRSNIKEDYK